MSLSLYRVPDGPQNKGQSASPCPSVYSPAPALGSLSSVALSSVQAEGNLAQNSSHRANYRQFFLQFSSGFLAEATIPIWSGFLREAIRYPTRESALSIPQAANGALAWSSGPLLIL